MIKIKKQLFNYTYLLFILLVILLLIFLPYFLKLKKETDKIYPEYNNKPYVYLNNNIPSFKEEDYLKKTFENYSNLDYLGRVGIAFAKISKALMPTEDRKSINNIYPTGWNQEKYDIIDGKYLYNRCHLIGFQLTGENDNKKNLMTCTRQMNSDVMLDFENQIASYIKETNDEVLYRIIPYFENNNLLATGIQLEASSVKDRCKEICLNIFIYNVQDGIYINYKTGESKLKNNN